MGRAGLVFRGDRVRGTPSAIAFRAGLTRRAPGALGLSGPPIGHSVFKSRAAQQVLRAAGTISERAAVVKRGWRDLLDKRAVGRYSRLRDCERCCVGEVTSGAQAAGLARRGSDYSVTEMESDPNSFRM